ncbi:germination protein YpeB [Serpentinicella alkaliphila]|uniref:Germination protein YpeB n=1 Tax=Serpentinicella alkaliphila TaxID=1734049 RepID=A0A4R2U3I0_9FIRM|nr:germination protein YpeB [Serpentinicella alkaliphila]QUH24545.1 germination protein YpeB [Serpentinicella alkaliphila]TCQ04639.1 germination protein YpeB [Serpentinicella alkaliphila]
MNWRRYTLPIALGLALLVSIGWGAHQYNQKIDYHTYLDLQFQRQFYELIGHVKNAQVDLAKAMVAGSTTDTAKYLNDTVYQSYMAQNKLTQLPLDHLAIRRVEKFLSQLGDYSTAMVNKSLDGVVLTDDEMGTLTDLHSYVNLLAQELIVLQQQIVKDGVNFGDLRRNANRNLQALNKRMETFNGLINMEERMQEYPELIYDGPFSEHMTDRKSRLTGKEIDEKQAIDVLRNTIKEDLTNIEIAGDVQNTVFTGYYIRAQKPGNRNGDNISAVVTRQGGKLLWYINPRIINQSRLDKDEAIEIAQQFLNDTGYEHMVPTYTIAYEGQILINFAYKQDNVIVYPDLIKVKVALDNGEIIGYEAHGFLMSHHERDIPDPEISEEQAMERLSSAVEVENVRLVIIPTAGDHELLCYEFRVTFGEDRFLIYIDAKTGDERKILLMVEQEDGTLVI